MALARGLFAAAMMGFVVQQVATAQVAADGSVIDHSGENGDLIVSRDGVVYWLSEGDDLFKGDVIRARYANMSTVTYNGCVTTLPENEDVLLDDEFCVAAVLDEPTMAEIASESDVANFASGTNAPLVVGGVVLSAGGLAAASNGGNSGTGSVTSVAAGAQAGAADP